MQPPNGPPRNTRRLFLFAASSLCFAATETGKGRTVPASLYRFPDPSTEFPVIRLTDPQYSSFLPRHYNNAISRRNFLIYSSDMSGRMEVYRMDLKSGTSRQLTEAANLEPRSVSLSMDERSLFYMDGGSLQALAMSNLRNREVYRIPNGFERAAGFSISDDGLYGAVIERAMTEGTTSHHRLRLVRMADGVAVTLAEADDELTDPIPRPRRASVLYRRGDSTWLANYDAQQNYRLRLAEGSVAEAVWSPDGRSILYLNVPADTHKLRNLREYTPDTNEEKAIANTTQYACFERNADASVFVGASGSKASPHVLLLVRTVRREFTLCEHRASDPRMVAPVFAPNSQHVYFVSDQHGKPAIYAMAVEKLVTETADEQ
jgi:oligogalacturonide lyase